MLNFFTKRLNRKNKKGFTLVELIVVIAIVAVLAAVGIPAIAGYVAKSKQATLDSNAKTIATQAQVKYSNMEAQGKSYSEINSVTVEEIAKLAGIDTSKFDITIEKEMIDVDGNITTDSSKAVSVSIKTVRVTDKDKTSPVGVWKRES